MSPSLAAGLCLGAALVFLACSYTVTEPEAPSAGAGSDGAEAAPDGSRCEYRGRRDREVAESVGTGAMQPSIRRVYRLVGEGAERRRILICREVDTNLDGRKDVVRRYGERGEPLEELGDTDHDGVLDTRIRFSRGKIAEEQIDTNQDDKPEETRYYQDGKLSRVQRDTNGDGNPDIWEIYSAGQLQRMGIDVDHDGRVDRWNRDAVKERARRAAEEREATPAGAGASEARPPEGQPREPSPASAPGVPRP